MVGVATEVAQIADARIGEDSRVGNDVGNRSEVGDRVGDRISEPPPVLSVPEPLFGRQTPTSCSGPQS